MYNNNEINLKEISKKTEENEVLQKMREAEEKYYEAKFQNLLNMVEEKETSLKQLIEEKQKQTGGPVDFTQGVQDSSQTESIQISLNRPQQRVPSVKEELQRGKEQIINESKLFLSKQCAELERKNTELTKTNQNLQNRLNQATQEKDGLKLQISNLKNQLRVTNEMSSDVNLRNHIQSQIANQNSNQNYMNSQVTASQPTIGRLANETHPSQPFRARGQSLAERRDQFKSNKNNLRNEAQGEVIQRINHQLDQLGGVESPSKIRSLTPNQQSSQHKNQHFGKHVQPVDHEPNVFERLTSAKTGLQVRKNFEANKQKSRIEGNKINYQNSAVSLSQDEIIRPPRQPTQTKGTIWRQERAFVNCHDHGIQDIDSCENFLYSASTGNLKVWDVNEMKQISSISAHNCAIKCVKVAPEGAEASIFATAGDKNDKKVILWDMISLTKMATLSGHKGEIRALEFSSDGNYLFSAGQGGMLVWDLRKQGGPPLEVIEKKKDVFSLRNLEQHIFIGSRDATIIPVGMNSEEVFQEQVLKPLEVTHSDVVSQLASMHNSNFMISASRDMSIKLWKKRQISLKDCWNSNNIMAQDPYVLAYSVENAHTDRINAVQQSIDQTEVYTGGKDGVVNVWRVFNSHQDQYELSKVSSIVGDGAPVTAITSLSQSFGKMIVIAGADNKLSICKEIEMIN